MGRKKEGIGKGRKELGRDGKNEEGKERVRKIRKDLGREERS